MLDGEVNDAPAEETDKDKPSIKFWISQLKAAEKAKKRSDKWTKASIEEYLAYEDSDPEDANDARYPLWWASVKTLQPAIYARTPIPVSRKAFDDLDDNLARLGSLCQRRLANYLIGCTPYDRVQYTTRDTFIHSGKTTERVYFESETKTERIYYSPSEIQQPPLPQPPGLPPAPPPPPIVVYLNAQGEQIDQSQLQQDEEGKLFHEVTSTEVKVCLIPIHYKDLLHTPNARDHEEIDWMAFRSLMHKEDVAARFGAEIAETITYKSRDEDEEEKTSASEDAYLAKNYCDVWEIWDKRKKQVYWYIEGHTEDFVDTKPDPYELIGFFPCPSFMLGTVSPSNLYPIPDFAQLRPLIRQIDAMADRLQRLIRSMKYVGLYDSSNEDLKMLANMTRDGLFLGVRDLKQLIGEGGLQNLVMFFPVEKFIEGANILAQFLNLYENKFYELYKIPDIIRGVSDPTETAAAQQLKGQYHTLGISQIQREFQRVNRDIIELMVDLALKVFPEEKIIDVVGVNFMEPADQQLWPQVYSLLRDDKERKIRIDIETDSTITMNQTAEIEKMNYLAKNLFEGLNAVASASERNPDFAPVGLKMLTLVIQATEKGEQVEQLLTKLADKMLQPPDPSIPPPPDPEMMKIELQQQELGLKSQEIALNADDKNKELFFEAQKVNLETQLENQKLQLKTQEQLFNQQLLMKDQELEQMKVILSEREKLLTEQRLQREELANNPPLGTGEARGSQKLEITVGDKKPSRRMNKIIRDENGEIAAVESVDVPDELEGLGL